MIFKILQGIKVEFADYLNFNFKDYKFITLDCPKHSSLRENISNFDPVGLSVWFLCEEAKVISDEPPPQSKDPT